MIVRILNGDQWEVDADQTPGLNELDDAVERAVAADNQADLTAALQALLDRVRGHGTRLADDDLRDSDLILPAPDASIEDVRALLNESDQGLIPD